MASFPWDDNFGGDDWKDLTSQFLDPSTISQSQTAIEQRHKAKELEKNNIRPDYNIPASEQEALSKAEANASNKITRLPGQSAIEGRLDQTTANQISVLERMGIGGADMINGASRAYGNQQQAENTLGVAAANYSAGMNQHNQDVLFRQLGINAEYQDKQWDWNKRLPYERDYALMQALKGASIQNSNEAWNTSVGGTKDFFENFYSMGTAKSNSANKGGGNTGYGNGSGYGNTVDGGGGRDNQNILDSYGNSMIT